MLLADLVTVSSAVADTRSRSKKAELLADALRRLSKEETPVAVSYLAGKPTQKRLGVGYATVYAVQVAAAAQPELSVLDVEGILTVLAATTGPGSKARRETLLDELFSKATEPEQEFLRSLLLRNVRQGALDGVMADAVALALGVPGTRLRRAAMLEGDLVSVASRALVEGAAALGDAELAVFTAVQPMLAATAQTAGEAVASIGTAIVEEKLDGARIQVHRDGDVVKVYTRNLRDITNSVPEVVAEALQFNAESFILDGEALLFGPLGSMDFQDSMSRFGSEGSEHRRSLSSFYFDILHLDGKNLLDAPLSDRRAAMEAALPKEVLVGSIVTDDADRADRFFSEAVAAGYEGVVVKDPGQPYEAGRRGAGWLKVKPTYTLDLVILAVEWGSGRRQGWLSNLHLGARDPAGEFVMLGKTFKGLTDEMLAWQTERFLEIETSRSDRVVYLEPKIVYEIAFDGVQRSTRYPGGVALRFARVKRYRDDKTPSDVDTLEAVRGFLR